MHRTSLHLIALTLSTVALGAACTLISEVDRSKIAQDETPPAGTGGEDSAGGQGGDSASGGSEPTGGAPTEGGAGGQGGSN